MPLPPGYKIAYGGESEIQEETFGEMKYVLAAAIMLIFLILLIQFRTLLDPLIIMTALPLAVPGAALGLILTLVVVMTLTGTFLGLALKPAVEVFLASCT